MNTETKDPETKAHVIRCLQKGIRYDGRKADQFRAIKIERGVSGSAEGSAIVHIGDTQVIVGVKLSVETPYADRPDEGNIMVNAELLPLSSSEFEPGPPGPYAVEVARVTDRGIREAHAIDVHQLVIEKGVKVWSVAIDVCTLNDNGGLIDAAALGALAAIEDTKFPMYSEGKIDFKTKTDKKLPIVVQPLAVTVYKIGPYLLVDPLPEEEKVAEARLTITTTENGKVCSLQKGGDQSLTIDEIDQMVAISLEKGKEIRKLLKSAK